MMRLLLVSLLAALSLSACTALLSPPITPQKTQLELRQLQTREFSGVTIEQAMKALLDVLQDDGFIVKNAVSDLGLLTAIKEVDVLEPSEAFWQSVFRGEEARWKRNAVIEVTVNVRALPGTVRIRANFQAKTLDNQGGVIEVRQINESEHYREFFSKVDKGLYLYRHRL